MARWMAGRGLAMTVATAVATTGDQAAPAQMRAVQAVNAINRALVRNADLPWSNVLGSGSLGDMDYFFDVDQRHACMLVHDNLH